MQFSSSMQQFLVRACAAAGIFLLALLLLLLVWYTGRVFLLGFAGVILGVFLNVASDSIAKRTPLNYGWALALVLALLVALATFSWWGTASRLTDQLTQMTQTLPESLGQLKEKLGQYAWGQWLIAHSGTIENAMQREGTLSRITGFAASVIDFVIGIIVILFVGVYLAAEPQFYHRGIVRLVPQAHRHRAAQVLSALRYNLWRWILGRIVALTVIGFLTGVGLWLLGMPLVLTLALIAAVSQVIPNLGPLLAAVPALLIAWAQGPRMVLYVGLLYLGIQTVESYLVTPLVQRRGVRMPPALVILMMVVFGIFGGILGLVVAAPLTVVAMVLVQMLYIQDALGDRSVRVLGQDAPRSAA